MLCQWNMPYTKFNILYAIKIILPWTFCAKQIIKIQSIKSIRKIHKNKFAYLSMIYQVDKINKYQTLYILSIYSWKFNYTTICKGKKKKKTLPLKIKKCKYSKQYDFFSRCIKSNCCRLVTKSYLTLCNTVGYSPPGSSVHRISQARILD